MDSQDTKNRLENLGYMVSAVVPSGEQAIKEVEQNTPDVVLMDIVLKGDIQGIEAGRQIKGQFGIPVIYMTGYPINEVRKEAGLLEPYEYLVKPVEIMDMKSSIELALQTNDTQKLREISQPKRDSISKGSVNVEETHDERKR